MDIRQQRRKDGAQQIEEMRRDEYADLDPILLELAREGRIIRLPSPTSKEMVILKNR